MIVELTFLCKIKTKIAICRETCLYFNGIRRLRFNYYYWLPLNNNNERGRYQCAIHKRVYESHMT